MNEEPIGPEPSATRWSHGRRWLVAAVAVVAAVGVVAAVAFLARPDAASAAARPGTTSCGDVRIVPLHAGAGIPAAPLDCLVQAIGSGRPATLKVTESTTEGDPIVVVYSARTDGAVEVVNDATQDRYAGTGPRVTHWLCHGLSVVSNRIRLDACSALDEPAP